MRKLIAQAVDGAESDNVAAITSGFAHKVTLWSDFVVRRETLWSKVRVEVCVHD